MIDHNPTPGSSWQWWQTQWLDTPVDIDEDGLDHGDNISNHSES